MMIDETSRLDEALRHQHHTALEQVSPSVRAQLAQRRHAALRGTAPRRSHRLGFAAAGFAALCALAIGVQFPSPPTPIQAPDRILASTILSPARGDSIILDQDPDFYAWLASSDAMQVAME